MGRGGRKGSKSKSKGGPTYTPKPKDQASEADTESPSTKGPSSFTTSPEGGPSLQPLSHGLTPEQKREEIRRQVQAQLEMREAQAKEEKARKASEESWKQNNVTPPNGNKGKSPAREWRPAGDQQSQAMEKAQETKERKKRQNAEEERLKANEARKQEEEEARQRQQQEQQQQREQQQQEQQRQQQQEAEARKQEEEARQRQQQQEAKEEERREQEREKIRQEVEAARQKAMSRKPSMGSSRGSRSGSGGRKSADPTPAPAPVPAPAPAPAPALVKPITRNSDMVAQKSWWKSCFSFCSK